MTTRSASSGSLVFVGRLSPEKRADLFLQAARLLAERWPDLDFVVIGGGPLEAQAHRLAERWGLRDRVCFAGLRVDVGQLLRGASVLVCPSDTEGTPRAVIEAMSGGVPVVATRVGGLPDLITDGTTGVQVADADGRISLLAAELAKIKSMVTVNTSSLSQAVVAGVLLAADGMLS